MTMKRIRMNAAISLVILPMPRPSSSFAACSNRGNWRSK